MKKSDSKNQGFSGRIVGMLVIISMLFLNAGCDKSESTVTPSNPTPVGTPANPTNSIIRVSDGIVIPVQFLEIDHHSIGLGGHDYKVVLFDDGSVLFQGRANVAYLGDHVSHIDIQTVDYIRNMFLASQFYSIPSSNPLWRMPFVETTFAYESKVATVRDVNDGIPQIILQIRSKAEDLMQVQELIERSPVAAIPVDQF